MRVEVPVGQQTLPVAVEHASPILKLERLFGSVYQFTEISVGVLVGLGGWRGWGAPFVLCAETAEKCVSEGVSEVDWPPNQHLFNINIRRSHATSEGAEETRTDVYLDHQSDGETVYNAIGAEATIEASDALVGEYIAEAVPAVLVVSIQHLWVIGLC